MCRCRSEFATQFASTDQSCPKSRKKQIQNPHIAQCNTRCSKDLLNSFALWLVSSVRHWIATRSHWYLICLERWCHRSSNGRWLHKKAIKIDTKIESASKARFQSSLEANICRNQKPRSIAHYLMRRLQVLTGKCRGTSTGDNGCIKIWSGRILAIIWGRRRSEDWPLQPIWRRMMSYS